MRKVQVTKTLEQTNGVTVRPGIYRADITSRGDMARIYLNEGAMSLTTIVDLDVNTKAVQA